MVSKKHAIKLKELYELIDRLYRTTRASIFIDDELYSNIVELRSLVGITIDNIEIYEEKELEEIIQKLEDVLIKCIQQLKKEVV